MRRHLPLLVLLPLLAAPAAQGASATLAVEVHGGAFFPEGQEAQWESLALLAPDPRGAARLEAARVVAATWENNRTRVGNGGDGVQLEGTPPRATRETLTRVDATLRPLPGAAYLAVWSEQGHFRIRQDGAITARAAALTRLDHGVLAAGDTADEDWFFQRTTTGTHILVEGEGGLRIEGTFRVKVFGLHVEAASGNGVWEVHTGGWTASAGPATLVGHRWLVLDVHDGVLVLPPTPVRLVAETGELAWAGAAVFEDVSGRLRASGGERAFASPRVILDGRFDASLHPFRDAGVALLADLRGDLRDSNIQEARAPAPGGAVPPFLVLLAAVVAVASGGLLAARRRAPPGMADFSADACMAFAGVALERQDWARARHWASRAAALAPTSAQARGTWAFALAETGDTAGALRRYAEASCLDPSGEWDYEAALLAASMGAPLDVTEEHLLAALRRDPPRVVEVEDEPAFAPLRGRPRLEAAIRAAWGARDQP